MYRKWVRFLCLILLIFLRTWVSISPGEYIFNLTQLNMRVKSANLWCGCYLTDSSYVLIGYFNLIKIYDCNIIAKTYYIQQPILYACHPV